MNGVPGHSYVMNGGNLENNGYSVGLSGVPVKTRDWQWNLYTYFSGNLNKVRSQTVEKYTIDSYLNGTALVDGEAVSSFYSYRFLGLNPANGVPVFNDYADRMHLLEDRELEDIVLMTMEKSGQRDPIFTGSLSTSLTYKSLSLSVNMSYSLGSKVRLFSLYEPILNGVSAEKNIRKEFVNRWMAPGDELNTNVPVILSPSDPDYFSSLVHFSSVTSSDISHIQQFANSVWDMYDKSDIRVVSGTHGVDVVLLHQLEIFLDAIHSNGAAFAMIVVVTVDAVQHHITVIDPEQTVAHFDITEANALWHHFQNVAVGVFQRHDQMVKIRGFC